MNAIIAPSTSTDHAPNDPHRPETHEQPTVKQLIEYKRQIRLENDRRAHRQQLADLAKKEREKLHVLQPDLAKPIDLEHHQQHKTDGGRRASDVASATDASRSIKKPIAASKNEEEILNEENIFQPRRHRIRDRQRPKTSTVGSDSPILRREHAGSISAAMRTRNQSLNPLAQLGICKVCGNTMNVEGDQLKGDMRQVFSKSGYFV